MKKTMYQKLAVIWSDMAKSYGTRAVAVPAWEAPDMRANWSSLAVFASALAARYARLADAAAPPTSEMEEAVRAGDGTLHGAITHWQNKAVESQAENTRLKELLEQTRGSVKQAWIGWEKYQIRKSKEGFQSHQDGSAECTRLLNLLDEIDAITAIEKEGSK